MKTSCSILKSEIDESVNFILPIDDGGYFESRYVRRHPEYMVCYLSSQSGCNRGCQFCHLTTTKQTMFTQANIYDFIAQAMRVFEHYKENCPKTKYVHYNWMARGEALCNLSLIENSKDLLFELGRVAGAFETIPKFNVSTIMPKTLESNLDTIFPLITPTIYYSLYSMREEFRAKWLPGAMEPNKALDLLQEYQDFSKKLIKLHFALIEGENDNLEDIELIANAINERNMSVELNLVQYNPADNLSKESNSYNLYLQVFQSLLGDKCRKAKIIKRVGSDVFASCGTFPTGEDI